VTQPSEPEPEPGPAAAELVSAATVGADPVEGLVVPAGAPPCSWYAVWCHPARPDLRGVHGPGLEGWVWLARTFGGRSLRDAGVWLRRAESFEDAVRLYETQAVRHGAPVPAPVFSWSQRGRRALRPGPTQPAA